MKTLQLAEEMKASIIYAIDAHTMHAQAPHNRIRYWDRTTPYVVHPIWCAMTLLTETALSEEIRFVGYHVLLWHDILEDTTDVLPEDTPVVVQQLVDEMTFANAEEEMQLVWTRSDTTKLLKLYDKVSILMDADWMNDAKWDRFVAYTLKLIDFVVEQHGELNIVKIARGICVPR